MLLLQKGVAFVSDASPHSHCTVASQRSESFLLTVVNSNDVHGARKACLDRLQTGVGICRLVSPAVVPRLRMKSLKLSLERWSPRVPLLFSIASLSPAPDPDYRLHLHTWRLPTSVRQPTAKRRSTLAVFNRTI
jgi:hypothetical protein